MPEDVLTAANVNGPNLIDKLPIVSSRLKAGQTGHLKAMIKEVKRKAWVTTKEIRSEIHSRLVFGLGCITLIAISIALGIIFRGGHLLSAFGASSIPAGALIVCIMAGKDLTKTNNPSMPETIGVIVMWIGLAALSVAAVMIYRKLTRT